MNTNTFISDAMARSAIEQKEEWLKWLKELPFIQFPADWQVQIIPPFAGAQVRFRVKLPSGTEKSIYFDAYNKLGCYDGPYWEVYPYQSDVGRCDMLNVPRLLEMIGDESEN